MLALGSVIAAGLSLASPSFATGMLILISLVLVALNSIPAAAVIMIVIAPWASLGNVMTGGRLVPVGLDLFLVALAGSVLLSTPTPARSENPLSSSGGLPLVNGLVWTMLIVGAICVFNPSGLGLVGGLEGYRAFFLPMLGLPVGRFLGRRAHELPDGMLTAIVVTSLLIAAMGIRQVFAPAGIDKSLIEASQSSSLTFLMTGTNRLRAFSPLPGPFQFGLLMMLATVICTGRLVEHFRLILLPVLIVLLFALALNGTRLTWLGTATGVVIITLGSLRRENVLLWAGRLGALTAFLLLAGLLIFKNEALSTIVRFSTTILNPESNTSLLFRVLGWYHDIFPAIRQSPLVGYGAGMAKDGLGPFTSHNIFLKILLEGGAVLLALYLAVLILVAVFLARRLSGLHARIGLAALAGVHAAGLFAPILDAYPGNLYFWLMLGLSLSTAERTERSRFSSPGGSAS